MPDKDKKQMFDKDNNDNPKREDSQKVKRIIIFAFAGMLLFIVLFYAGTYLISKIGSNAPEKEDDEYNPTHQTITFFTPDYNEDIYKDEYYMGLDRSIYYCDTSSGLTVELIKADYLTYSEGLRFMYDFVNYIIAGDAESYNECFSLDYYLSSDVEEKEAFTMQKLYNIVITKVSETTGTGVATEYIYIIEYMIRQNNGTFRTDMGSDASKKQYITVTEKSGILQIDSVSNVFIK